MTVDIPDLIKHSTKKSGKCPKTLREDGSRNLRGCNMKSQTRRKGVVTLNDVDELDAIIEESTGSRCGNTSPSALRPSCTTARPRHFMISSFSVVNFAGAVLLNIATKISPAAQDREGIHRF